MLTCLAAASLRSKRPSPAAPRKAPAPLPSELWLQVFQQLDLRELGSVSLTCKPFQQLVRDPSVGFGQQPVKQLWKRLSGRAPAPQQHSIATLLPLFSGHFAPLRERMALRDGRYLAHRIVAQQSCYDAQVCWAWHHAQQQLRPTRRTPSTHSLMLGLMRQPAQPGDGLTGAEALTATLHLVLSGKSLAFRADIGPTRLDYLAEEHLDAWTDAVHGVFAAHGRHALRVAPSERRLLQVHLHHAMGVECASKLWERLLLLHVLTEAQCRALIEHGRVGRSGAPFEKDDNTLFAAALCTPLQRADVQHRALAHHARYPVLFSLQRQLSVYAAPEHTGRQLFAAHLQRTLVAQACIDAAEQLPQLRASLPAPLRRYDVLDGDGDASQRLTRHSFVTPAEQSLLRQAFDAWRPELTAHQVQ